MVKKTIEKPNIKVSIIVPMYMCEGYVENVLQSLCAQDLDEIEIICVVDGSPDNTFAVAKGCAESDSRIEVFNQEHGGAGAARNLGLDYASGEFVMFLDADDDYGKSFVSKMYQAISETKADIAVCRYIRQDNWEGTSVKNAGFSSSLLNAQNIIEPKSIPGIIYQVSSMVHNRIYRKSFIDECGVKFSETQSLNDIFFANATMISARRVALIPESLYTYRMHHNASSITSNRHHSRKDVLTVYGELYEWLKAKGRFEYYKTSFFRRWRDSFAGYCRYGIDADFQDAVVRVMGENEPWSLMDDKTLYSEAGLSATLAKTRRLIWSRKLKRKADGKSLERAERKVRQFTSEEENKRIIRDKLKSEYGKAVNKKDSIVRDGVVAIRRKGIKRTVSKLVEEATR